MMDPSVMLTVPHEGCKYISNKYSINLVIYRTLSLSPLALYLCVVMINIVFA
jgi:hypothetical protein